MRRGILSVAVVATFTLNGVCADSCSQYQDCTDCLNPKDPALNCGWCSPTPAVAIPSMTPLTRCMDHTSKGWLCPDLYMKTGCVAGYVCNHTTGQCNLGPPGEGGHKDKCEESCHPPAPPPPPQFVCNATTLQCEQAPRHGQSTKQGCDATCGKRTPSELVGLWRGLDVQAGFSVGEWVMNFTNSSVTWGPIGSPALYSAEVAMLGPQHLELTLSNGDVRLATYSKAGWPTGPETWSLSIAVQSQDSHVAPPDNLPGDALGQAGLDVYVFHGCHEYHQLCNFAPAFAPARRRLLESTHSTPPQPEQDLPDWLRGIGSNAVDAHKCLVHKSCGECINDATNVCGWCDGIITFSDGTTCGEDGNGCCGGSAGFAQCDPGYRKACPVICDWNSHPPAGKHPFCREATSKEFNSSTPKYSDCAALNASQSCNVPDFGQYCDKTAGGGEGQCKSVKTKQECQNTPGCNVTNPTCTDAKCNSAAKTITYCDPDTGCKGPVSKAECEADPNCDPSHSGCNPNECKAPSWYTCDKSSWQCVEHLGARPPPGTIYFNSTDDCKKACVNHDVTGVWRGLRVDSGFVADEWDFKFSQASHMPAGASVVFKSKKTFVTYTGTYQIGAALSSEPFGAFEIIITLSNGDVLKGLFATTNSDQSTPAQGPYTRFLYLGLPTKNGDAAISYDDAMGASKQEFVLISCLPSEANCDFSSASPSSGL
jgi:hypothetical protein